jgi:hypothetical protein
MDPLRSNIHTTGAAATAMGSSAELFCPADWERRVRHVLL